jgi:hypothetical protein
MKNISLLLLLVVVLCVRECSASPAVQNDILSRANIDFKTGYKLPVIPQAESEHFDPAIEIPKNIWMTTKYPHNLMRRANHFLAVNKDCSFHVLGDDGMDEFMATRFANTSVLWSYAMINPELVAAKVDIWRIATLWLNGGLYMDADSTLSVPFENVVAKDDRFIFASEGNPYQECYAPSFHLNQTESSKFAAGKFVVNWLMISAPKHPFLTQALYTIVEAITNQYLRQTYLGDVKIGNFGQVICSTGPGVLTAAISTVLDGKSKLTQTDPPFRYVGQDWGKYGGEFRTPKSKGGIPKYTDATYYPDVFTSGGRLLHKYVDNK